MATTSGQRLLDVRLITPEGTVFEGPARMIVVPGAAGELGLLARHEPLVTSLKFGETRITREDGEVDVYSTTAGYLSIGADKVFMLVEQAEELSTIDVPRAESALQRAVAALESASPDDTATFIWAEAAKHRAENRLKVVRGERRKK